MSKALIGKSVRDVMSTFESDPKAKVEVLGRMVSGESLLKKLQEAIYLVKSHLNGLIEEFDLNEIFFAQLEKNVAASVLGNGKIKLDFKMLFHPVSRLAMVLTHELLHDKGKVPKDELVDAMVANFFPEGVMDSAYDAEEVLNFAKTAGMKIEELWQLYRKGQFRSIYIIYAANTGNKKAALEEMQRVFPELTFTEKVDVGWTVKEPKFKGVTKVREETARNVAEAA
ncbi:hypothetical protein KA119_01200 [Candidatus Gracilibacteria bacterium]|nr:hypothetical protein [Candidatus Gracilibacteria bacterium]